MSQRLFVIALGTVVIGTVISARQIPPPPPPPPATSLPSAASDAPRGTGAISGVVLDRSTGAPLAGTTVTLSQRGNAQGFQSQRFVTDVRGRFVIRDLPPGNAYVVMASKPGFFDAYYGALDAEYASAQPISLADGQWVSTVEIRLTRLGVITGRVTDEAGEPVVGAFVRTLTEISIAGRPQLAVGDFARTDDRGEYRISGLRAGRYIVSVPSVQHALPMEMPAARSGGPPRAADPATIAIDADTRLSVGAYVTPPPRDATPRAYPAVFFPDARSIAEATPIQLGMGQTETADLRLQPVPTWRVSGLVEAAEGGAAGLVLRLVAPGLEDLGIGSETATAVVDARGRFAFVNVPAGRYTLEGRRSVMEYRYASGAGSSMLPFPASPAFSMQSGGGGSITGAPPGVSYSHVTSSSGGDLSGRVEIDVNGRDVSGVVLPLRRPVRLSGRIEREPEESTTTAEPPAPAGGFRALVQVQPANGSASLGMLTGQTGEDGRFEINGLLAGPYVLRVLGGGVVRSITWAGKDVTNAPFDGSSGQDFTDVVVTLTRKTTTIAGTVRRSSAGSSAVIVFPVDRGAWTNYGFSPARLISTLASSNGSYTSQIPGGEYYVAAVDARFQRAWQDPAFLAKLAPLATRVTLDWGEKKTLDLTFAEVP